MSRPRPTVAVMVKINGKDTVTIVGASCPPALLPHVGETRLHHFINEQGMVTVEITREDNHGASLHL